MNLPTGPSGAGVGREMKSYALPFAAWELRLYLDTHPDDRNALEAFRQLTADGKSCGYALPMTGRADNTGENADRWTWIDDPWPWEYAANRPEEDD